MTPARCVLAPLLAAGLAAGTAACGLTGGGVQQAGETEQYPTIEGDTVYLDPTKPLLASVLNDIACTNQQVVDAIPGAGHAVPPGEVDPSQSAVSTIAQNAAWAGAACGREIIVVYRVWGAPDVGGSPGAPQWLWRATRGSSPTAIPDKAARVAEVEAYVAASDGPEAYEVVVLH